MQSNTITKNDCIAKIEHQLNGLKTSFANITIKKGNVYTDHCTSHFYIVIIMSGEVTISCKLYQNRLVKTATMAFIPRNGEMHIKANCDSNILLFGFTTTIIRSDKELLEYFCTNAGKKNYTFNTLSICESMNDFLKLITAQIHDKKLKHSGICHLWNTYFFHIMIAYYKKDEITAFLRPIISGGADFKSFIENNYLEAEGNVSRLIILSGLSAITFKTRFKAIFGMTAKNWLDERMKEQILLHAAEKNMGTNQMAYTMKMLPQKLNRICHRFWGITTGEVIRRIQRGEPLTESNSNDR